MHITLLVRSVYGLVFLCLVHILGVVFVAILSSYRLATVFRFKLWCFDDSIGLR